MRYLILLKMHKHWLKMHKHWHRLIKYEILQIVDVCLMGEISEAIQNLIACQYIKHGLTAYKNDGLILHF